MSTPTHTSEPRYDLEERLLNYAADIIRFTESMLKTDSGRHVSNQLMRSGTSPLGQQGEAVSAESSKDFIHKMKVALKELRETDRWLKLVVRVPLIPAKVSAKPLLKETDELIRIFVASIKTAQRNATK
ncbi:MAG: four helix bundle protein [Prosthecobacter sp.]|uniref:four helix bundle protein n=1 Tax=Prosthecobacter sp. TaxID=1965333 RepID=UPI0039017900